MPYPDRAHHPNRRPPAKEEVQALNIVRGGTVCVPGEKGAHVLQGSMGPAVCIPSAGFDPRPRWRDAGAIGRVHEHARHSTSFFQHRGIATTRQGLEQA
jgi:hypothetical protein